MESEMIERVARALCRQRRIEQCFKPYPDYTLDDEVGNAWDLFVVDARAALEAMREMVPVVRDHEGFPAHQLVGAPEDIWRTMIDAALSNSQEKNNP